MGVFPPANRLRKGQARSDHEADEAEEEANSAVGVEGDELGKIYLRMVSEWMIAGWAGMVRVCNGVFGVYEEFAPN